MRKLLYDTVAETTPKTIIMFLIVVLVFAGVFGTIALNLDTLSDDTAVAGGGYYNTSNSTKCSADDGSAGIVELTGIPGGPAMLGIVGILGIIIIVMWAIKRAF